MGAALLWREDDGWTERPGEDVVLLESRSAPPDGAAALKLTSGSTGEPAGIAVSEEALLADAKALANSMGLRADDRFAVAIPMSHSYGFSVDEKQLPDHLVVTHRNLNDNTIAGLRHRTFPAFSVQYHPEASAGPHDSRYLFELFLSNMMAARTATPAGR